MPESAAALLRARPLSGEQAAYLDAHTVPNPSAAPQATQTAPAEPQPHVPSTDRLVKGSTTFADLLSWGVSKERIETVLGVPLPAAPGIKVKDYCAEKGLAFETVKAALQAEVDQVK